MIWWYGGWAAVLIMKEKLVEVEAVEPGSHLVDISSSLETDK